MAKQILETRSWHPDFRVTSELPDIKIVRTKFMVRSALALVIVLLAGKIFYDRYLYQQTEASIANLEAEIESKKAESNQAISDNETFTKHQTKIFEFVNYFSAHTLPHLVLEAVSNTKVPGVTMQQVSFSRQVPKPESGAEAPQGETQTETPVQVSKVVPAYEVKLNGATYGDSIQSFVALENFNEALKKNEYLAARLSDFAVKVGNFNKDEGALVFSITFTLRSPAP